jgi:hypothetical protein
VKFNEIGPAINLGGDYCRRITPRQVADPLATPGCPLAIAPALVARTAREYPAVMRQRGPLLLVLSFLAVWCWGCMPDGSPPTGSDGECNNNGKCENDKESCQSCPSDCSCCHAINSVGNGQVSHPEYAEGKPDNRYAVMSGKSVLILALGQGIQNQTGTDFRLIGSVQASGTSGGITVSAKDSLPWAQGKWYRVGIWTVGATGNTGFDVGHVPFSGPSFSEIKLESTGGVVAKIDAIESIACMK